MNTVATPWRLASGFMSLQPRILCVDDQPDFLLLLEHFLGANGFTVVTAGGGEAALQCARLERFDAAVLDFAMPGMNGEQLALRLQDLQPDLPIVLFSGSTHDLPESVYSVVDLTLSKSFPVSTLVVVLKRLTGSPAPERRSQPRRHVKLAVEALTQPRITAQAVDLSSGGISINQALPDAVGSSVEIAVSSAQGELLFQTVAVVRHVAERRTGLAFAALPGRERETIERLCSPV